MGCAGETSYRRMDGMDKDKIREAVSQLKHEDEAYHESMSERLTPMTLIHLRSVIIDVDEAKIRNTEKRT